LCLVVFQLRFLSSWGDQYYIGLNGMELFDEFGEMIQLNDNSILFTHAQLLVVSPLIGLVKLSAY